MRQIVIAVGMGFAVIMLQACATPSKPTGHQTVALLGGAANAPVGRRIHSKGRTAYGAPGSAWNDAAVSMIRTGSASKEEGAREEIMGKMRIKWVVGTVVVAFVGAIGLAATRVMGEPSVGQPGAVPVAQEVPLGLEDPGGYIPADNPQTARKIELGRWLFFDKRLSKNGTVACATCHMPGLAFTDGQPVSTGIYRLQGGRSAPTAINRVYSKAQFWDGRADTLEDQSVGPFVSPVEHGFLDHNELVGKIKSIEGYRALFQEVFGREVTVGDVGPRDRRLSADPVVGQQPGGPVRYGR
jgi:hypothetical protein